MRFKKFSWFKKKEKKKGSQTICAGMAAVTHSDWVVPASRGHGSDVCGAGTAYTLATGPAVMLGHCRSERFGALVALSDVLVWHPVVWPGHVFHKTCGEWMEYLLC